MERRSSDRVVFGVMVVACATVALASTTEESGNIQGSIGVCKKIFNIQVSQKVIRGTNEIIVPRLRI